MNVNWSVLAPTLAESKKVILLICVQNRMCHDTFIIYNQLGATISMSNFSFRFYINFFFVHSIGVHSSKFFQRKQFESHLIMTSLRKKQLSLTSATIGRTGFNFLFIMLADILQLIFPSEMNNNLWNKFAQFHFRFRFEQNIP